jgi:hypothetical protein
MSGLSNLEMCSTTVPSEVINLKDLAAFQSKYIWSLNQTLNVAFLNDGSNTRYKTADEFPGAKVDPLQYEFDRQHKNKTFDMKKAVKRIVEERINPLIKGHLNFNFIEDKNLAVIRIQFNEMGGCSSQIGSQAKKIEDTNIATMQFSWFDVGTVLHEFGHALGLIHEHQNPKGKNIDWNKPALYAWGEKIGWDRDKVDEQIIQRMDINSVNGSDYDPKSIMLYFYPPEVTKDNKGTSQNLVLSDTDKKTINDQYGKHGGNTAQASPLPKKFGLVLGIVVVALGATWWGVRHFQRLKKKHK